MAYIDPDGMFNGDRMARLTDDAKLVWPYFWCATNSVGRIELNYRKLIGRAFHHFQNKPTEQQFWKWVEQFWAASLLFVYESNGQMWGQWDVSERYLPRHKLAADKRTPAPEYEDYSAWRDAYRVSKKGSFAKSFAPTNSARFEKSCVDKEKELEVEEELEEEKIKTFPADAGEESLVDNPPFNTLDEEPVKPIAVLPIEERLAEAYAPKIYDRHPKRRRDLGVVGVANHLKVILRKFPKSQRAEIAQRIDHNHEGWCASEGWQKDGGEFAKGLDNWLAPTKNRWDVEPPPRAGPSSSGMTKMDRAERIFVENLIEDERKRQRNQDPKGL